MAKIDHAPARWISTIAFRQHRDKTQVLSATYWTFALGTTALKKTLSGLPLDNKAVSEMGSPFKLGMLPETNGELLSLLDERLGLHRLQVLVLSVASTEAYLQDAIRLHVAAIGYGDGPRQLTSVGEAMAQPVLKSSTVPDMVEYAGDMLGIDMSTASPDLKRLYRLRCAAAHNGGVVTPKTLRDIPDVGRPIGERIKLSWDQLR